MNVRATLVKMILNAIELVSFILPPLATDCLDSAGLVEAYSILHLLKCNVFILYIYKIYSIKINLMTRKHFFMQNFTENFVVISRKKIPLYRI